MKQTSFVYCLNVAICLAWKLPYSYICVPWFIDGTIMSPNIIKKNANKNRFNYLVSDQISWILCYFMEINYKISTYSLNKEKSIGAFQEKTILQFKSNWYVRKIVHVQFILILWNWKSHVMNPFITFWLRLTFLLLLIFLIAHYHWTFTTGFFVRINGGGRGKDIIWYHDIITNRTSI